MDELKREALIPMQQQIATDNFYVQRMGTEDGPHTPLDLQMMARNGQIESMTMIRKASGGMPFPAKDVPGVFSTREWLVALLLSFFLGSLGIDRFYVGHTGLGIAKLLTCGGVGVWALIDLILFALGKVSDDRGLPLRK